MSASSKVTLYQDATRAWGLIEADALLTLAKLPDACVDAIVCDPPYAIDITGEAWDRFGGDALTAGKAFERWTNVWATEVRRVLKPGGYLLAFGAPRTFHRLVCGIEDAGLVVRDSLQWLYGTGIPKSPRLPGGLGTALKPAYEPILLARTPLVGTTTQNLDAWGTGALNIEAARVGEQKYWPANVALSHGPDCPVELLDGSGTGPSRLFYCAKTTRQEREAGCEQLPARLAALYTGRSRKPRVLRNIHPTVKPIALMRWLVRLATPPGGLVLDPFAGSGSTGAAAVLEGRQFLGIEREAAYVDIACARLTHWAHKAGESS
jgi:site-specific DNA-methyltransferase (adenine-specific)